MRRRRSPTRRLAARGVYCPPWLDEEGFEYLVAVNSTGSRIYKARIYESDDREEIAAMVQRFLDAVDPVDPAAVEAA